MSIRKLTKEDKPSISALMSSTQMFQDEEIAFVIETFDGNYNTAIWFGSFDANNKMNGVAYCVPMKMTNSTWNVLMLLVSPEYHRSGIGKSLMRHIEKTLSDQSQRLLVVETSSTDDFDIARKFYSAIGYSKQGVIEHYYDENDHKVIFTKKL